MNKYFNTLTNARGDSLPNYRAQVVDSAGASVTIYSDGSGTRFTDSAGNIVNYATASSSGKVEFYWTAATGQVLQVLDTSAQLVDSTADFADNFVLSNLSGSIAQSAVTNLTTDLTARPTSAVLAASGGAALVGFLQSGTGAVTRTGQAKLRDMVSVKDFGAGGDGTTDDAAAIRLAIEACQSTARALYFPPGTYRLESALTITSGNPIAFVGGFDDPMQQGSTGPSVILKWYGGATAMVTCSVSACSFVNLAFQNFGTASDAIHFTGGQHYYLKRLSFLGPTGSTRFSRSCVYAVSGSLGYGRIEAMHFQAVAPKCLYLDGSVSSGGGTPLEISGRCVIESNATYGACTFLYMKSQDADYINIHDCTFNQQGNAELTIVDTTDTPKAAVMTAFAFCNNEIDTISNDATDRMLKLTNVKNIVMTGNAMQGGSVTNLVDLVNSEVTSFHSNYSRSVTGTILNADATSRVRITGPNNIDKATSGGTVNDGTLVGAIPVTVTTGTGRVILDEGDPGGNSLFLLSMAANDTVDLVVAIMSDSTRGDPIPGQHFTLQIKNTSGGTLTGITFNSVRFKVPTNTMPATGNSLMLPFVWDGSYARQIGAGAVVAN